jgi:catechol 2,3-dioxygenase
MTVANVVDRLPDSARIAYAEFLVRDRSNALAFYKDLVGLNVAWSRGETTALSGSPDGEPLVLLTEDRNAQPRSPRSAGLFHMALLYPTRRDLAAAFMRLHTQGWQIHGFADHGVSEALYMADADGNGVEFYSDKPQAQWPRNNGQLEMVTEPLDLENLLAEPNAPPQTLVPVGITIGHLHLQVTNLRSASEFYHETLGFDITQGTFPGALFLAAGGYHHHIGLNVWNSKDGSPSTRGSAGLVRFGIRVGSPDALQSLSARLQATPYWLSDTQRGALVHDADNIHIELL